MINSEYLKYLNNAQKEAVLYLDGPLLIVAGAGSGKTKVLTSRIAHIIKEKKAYPNQILSVTFTNKAAKEMQNRISSMLNSEAIGLSWLGTFHSICAKLLRKHANAAGLTSNFTIIDADDQIRLIKNICKSENVDIKQLAPKYILSIIDKWKNKGFYPNEVIINKKDIYENEKTNPTNPYSKTKLKLENYLRQLGEEKKVSCIILRYFNVSGADKKMRSGLMSNSENLIKAICEVATNKKETFVINGNDYNTKDGTPIRDFIHVSDLAEMHLISAEKIFKDNIVSTDIYNCGYGRGYSVKDVIKVINDLVTNKIQIEVGPRRKGDIEYSIANVSKFKKNFNWKPKFDDLKTILATALDWEKKI